ncbi:hypothetical protein LA080_009709 [Diaporthe eres]|nr:hypothetical protein LA080_009709 [Diaporthe eres]
MLNLAVVIAVHLLAQGALGVKLFNFTDQLPESMPNECKDALTGDISCSPHLFTPTEVTRSLDANTMDLDQYCSTGCIESLQDWAKNVHKACGNERYDFGYSTILGGDAFLQAPSDMADGMIWAQNVTCLKDSTSNVCCAPDLVNGTLNNCAACNLKYLAAMMSSWYGFALAPSNSSFTNLLQNCSADPSLYPYSNWTSPLPIPNGERNITCYGGCYYMVKEDDTCNDIAWGYGISVDRFLYQNGLDPSCQTLRPGSEVENGDTCESIISEKSFTMTELLAWNPTIHNNYDNLKNMVGRTICVSPPGTETYNFTLSISWVEWATPTVGSWTTAPTMGEPQIATNATAAKRTAIPTFVYNATAEEQLNSLDKTHCPITDDDFERGFEWYYLSSKCRTLLSPFCNPITGASEPAGAGNIPDECMPAVVMRW